MDPAGRDSPAYRKTSKEFFIIYVSETVECNKSL